MAFTHLLRRQVYIAHLAVQIAQRSQLKYSLVGNSLFACLEREILVVYSLDCGCVQSLRLRLS